MPNYYWKNDNRHVYRRVVIGSSSWSPSFPSRSPASTSVGGKASCAQLVHSSQNLQCNSGFCSMKWQRVLLPTGIATAPCRACPAVYCYSTVQLPPRIPAGCPWQQFTAKYPLIYSWVERGTVRVFLSCPRTQHMSMASTRPWTAQSLQHPESSVQPIRPLHLSKTEVNRTINIHYNGLQ